MEECQGHRVNSSSTMYLYNALVAVAFFVLVSQRAYSASDVNSVRIAEGGGHASTRLSKEKKREDSQAPYERRWSSIETPLLSPDGKWVIYVLHSPGTGRQIVIRNALKLWEGRIPLGSASLDEALHEDNPPKSVQIRITEDSRFLIFTDCRIGEAVVAKFNCEVGTIGIMNLSKGLITWIQGASVFEPPQQSGQYLAYLVGTDVISQGVVELPSKCCEIWKGNLSNLKQYKSLHIRNLRNSHEIQIAGVAEFAFDRQGQHLVYITFANVKELAAVYILRLSSTLANLPRPICSLR